MSKRISQLICVAIATLSVTLASSSSVSAQYPMVVNSVKPAVVGHSFERAGFFGLRTRVRPIVAPVVTPVAVNPLPAYPVTVVRPVAIVPSPTPVVYAAPLAIPTHYAPAPMVAPVTYVEF